MEKTFFGLAGSPLLAVPAWGVLAGLFLCFILLLSVLFIRKLAKRNTQMEASILEMARRSGEVAQRLNTMTQVLGTRQSDLARLFSDRLDAAGSRIGLGLENSAKNAGEHLARLNERLAVIDAAQARLTGLAEEVITLKDILSNKQSRGAYGQGRMEAIIRDSLPSMAYEFQARLSNHSRPDCIIHLPGDEKVLVIDAKFPLEAFVAFQNAGSEEARRPAMARVRNDVGKHIRDIAGRYLLPGETQDLALLFLPSESLYADLSQHFEDVMQKAYLAHIIIVSPQLLMMAIQLLQTLVRDGLLREQAHIIKVEVHRLVEDVERLAERVQKLDQHFNQAREDFSQITASAAKISRRGKRLSDLDFAPVEAAGPRAAE